MPFPRTSKLLKLTCEVRELTTQIIFMPTHEASVEEAFRHVFSLEASMLPQS